MGDRLYVGETGKILKVRVFDDADTDTLSGGTNLKLEIEKPRDGTTITPTATIPVTTPADKFLEYTIAAGDLNQAGVYNLHSLHDQGSNTFRGNKTSFEVFEKFKGPGEEDV